MPDKQDTILNIRYMALIKQETIDNWEDDDFVLKKSIPCWLDQDYAIGMFEPVVADGGGYTAEDVLTILDALAVHEEYTHGIITDTDRLNELCDIYSWAGSGGCLLADLLSEVERLSLIMNYLYIKYKVRIEIPDIQIMIGKDTKPIPVDENIEKLFDDDVSKFIYKNEEETLWWPFIIQDSGYFLVIIDPALDFEDEIEDEEDTTYPLALPEHIWGDVYDDEDDYYNYIDKYYKQKGLL